MNVFRTVTILASVVGLVCSGCVHSRQAATPSVPTPSQTPSATVEPDPILKIDLGNQRWTDVITGAKVELSGGKGTANNVTYNVESSPKYADANGDGKLDALAILKADDGKEAVSYAYIWLWDGRIQQPTQILDPVNIYKKCGNTYQDADKDPVQGFALSELFHDIGDKECEAKHVVKRTVVVGDDTRLIQTKPYLGYGGYCNQTAHTPEVRPEDLIIRSAPDVRSAMVNKDAILYYEMPAHQLREWPKGWQQVQWSNEEMKKNDNGWSTCGFVWMG